MKKIFKILLGLTFFGIIGCDTRTYEEISGPSVTPQLVKYSIDVKPIIDNNCNSCHSATGAASHYPLTDYALVKNAIDNILDRVQRPAGDPDKMPQGGSLSQQNIDILKKWKTDGLQE